MPALLHIFEKYKTPILIETGSYIGDGIQCALQAGYDLIKSVDISQIQYDHCSIRFKNNNKVQLFLGSTENMLWDMIKDIDHQITFWLDAHQSGEGTPMSHQKCPLEDELQIIAQHPIKNHIIMIDDMRCAGTVEFDYKSRELIENAILKINPNYTIVYEYGIVPNDILISYVE